MDDRTKDRSKVKLNKYIENRIKKMYIGVLDYTEVAVDSSDRWQALRSRILKICNDAIRDISKEVDQNYDIVFVPTKEDFIVVRKNLNKD